MAKNDEYSSDKESQLFRFSDRKKNKQEQQRCCQIQHKCSRQSGKVCFLLHLFLVIYIHFYVFPAINMFRQSSRIKGCYRPLQKRIAQVAVTEVDRNNPIAQLFPAATSTSRDVIKAKVMVTSFLIQHNPPIATTAHLGPPLFTTIFIDSKTAKLYTCSATKTAALINKAMGPTAMST